MPKPTNAYTGGRASTRKRTAGGKRSGRASGLLRLFAGLLLGIVLTVAGIVSYFYFGHQPVAVADKPALWEHLTETVTLHRRVAAEAKQPPFPASEDAFEAAAPVYRAQCAQCHGTPGREAAVGRQMLPHAQQFFGRDRRATAAKPVGELFWPTAFGVRRSGMPAYSRTLSNTQLWQLALLLHSADQELPVPVRTLLSGAEPAATPTTSAAVGKSVVIAMPPAKRDSSKDHLAPSERPESRF